MSASVIDVNLPIASAPLMPSIAASAISAAMRASLAVLPIPNRPSPGTSTTRGSGSCILRPLARGIFGAEKGFVIVDELLRRLVRGGLELVELARFRRGYDQRPWFGADGVVGRQHAGTDSARPLPVDVSEDRVTGAEFQDQALVRAFAAGISQCAGAAHDRRDLRHRRNFCGSLAGRRWPCVFCNAPLGQRHAFDHALVGFARRRQR